MVSLLRRFMKRIVPSPANRRVTPIPTPTPIPVFSAVFRPLDGLAVEIRVAVALVIGGPENALRTALVDVEASDICVDEEVEAVEIIWPCALTVLLVRLKNELEVKGEDIPGT